MSSDFADVDADDAADIDAAAFDVDSHRMSWTSVSTRYHRYVHPHASPAAYDADTLDATKRVPHTCVPLPPPQTRLFPVLFERLPVAVAAFLVLLWTLAAVYVHEFQMQSSQ